MKWMRVLQSSLVVLASMGVVFPQWAFGATTSTREPASPAVRDVSLQPNGRLQGQVLDSQGAPRAGIPVALVQDSKVVAATQTQADGRFAMQGVKAGVYQLGTANGVSVVRLWAPRMAPPAAQPQALVIDGDTVVRGGMGGGLFGLLTNPWVLAGLTATAIIVPLVLDDDDAS
jgi:hypothetical protein